MGTCVLVMMVRYGHAVCPCGLLRNPGAAARGIVEKTTKRRSGGGKLTLGWGAGAGVDASRGTDVERQATYSLEPNLKANISKVIDGLIASGDVKTLPMSDTVLSRDDLVEIEGRTRITACPGRILCYRV